MGAIRETKINLFDGGIASDLRSGNFRYSQLIKNLDAHLYPSKLVPIRSSESGDSAAATSQKQNFAIALKTGTTYSLYALGVKSGAATAEVLYKDLTTGAANDLDDATWSTPANNQSSSGSANFDLFVYYAKTGLIYGARSSRYIWAFSPSGAAWQDSERDLTSFSNISQGLVHSKDDILYIPYDNKIAKNDNGSWTSAAITLPSYLYITSICEYGNYLAIACAPLSGKGKSIVYLWDRDSSLENVSESIDWGEGNLMVLEEIEGRLIGISYVDGFSTKFVFREYSGGQEAFVFQQFISEATYTIGDLPIAKQKVNNYLYFMLKLTIDGTEHMGLWKLGRQSPGRPFSIVMDSAPNNDTATQTILNFIVYQDYKFIAYTASSNFALSKTDDTENYNITGVYESLIFNDGDSSKDKKLLGITAMTKPMPTAGQIVVKYKKDEETSWTTIFTNTTDDSIQYSAVNIQSSGATLPQFKEIKFRIEATGGAEITGLKFKTEEIANKPY